MSKYVMKFFNSLEFACGAKLFPQRGKNVPKYIQKSGKYCMRGRAFP